MSITIAEYKKTLTQALRQRTVALLLKEGKVLLGKKKRGFGQGYIVGIGGKKEINETIEQAAIRELKEEINIEVESINSVGVLRFYFPEVENPEVWNQEVHIFIVKKWSGQIQEGDEIAPSWYNLTEIPYDQMWDDAKYWLLRILEGEHIEAEFLFDRNQKVIELESVSLEDINNSNH